MIKSKTKYIPYKVKDINEAQWGRDELKLAESEMPGLMSLRAEYKKSKAKISEDDILSKIKDREEAKKNGNYKLADQIRDDLNKEGIDIKDEKGKTTWNYK